MRCSCLRETYAAVTFGDGGAEAFGAEMLARARSLPCSCRTLGEKATAGAAVALEEARETLAEDQRGKPGGLAC